MSRLVSLDILSLNDFFFVLMKMIYGSYFEFLKRKCAGRFIADAQLFITIASVLSLFDIAPEPGSNLEIKRPSYEELFTCRMERYVVVFCV